MKASVDSIRSIKTLLSICEVPVDNISFGCGWNSVRINFPNYVVKRECQVFIDLVKNLPKINTAVWEVMPYKKIERNGTFTEYTSIIIYFKDPIDRSIYQVSPYYYQ